ncbi:hypothetical protein [Komagataeibacter sp. FNDCR2]|uniref:hypothetical protein n=1 Tax=Komagataeibacter sp. FNDCR2 TaxID=2878682 RepID=UPI001E2F27F2|nr:hypothetical protein [Komagataeibacter sp. FNDCR2]MCE2574474.1 hypothetical protein [Komagataeibacter sp. FNDCR2]
MNDLSCSERLLVWCVRRLSGGSATTSGMPGYALPCFRADFAIVARAFNMALTRLRTYQCDPVDVAICSATRLTRTENRFLAAAAAAQEGHEAEVRSMLRPIFAHHHVLSPFAAAITQLGACMAGAGYWLPRRNPAEGSARAPTPRLRWTHGQRSETVNTPTAMPVAQAQAQTVGAGCLGAMRWRDADMAAARIMWPNSAAAAHAPGA